MKESLSFYPVTAEIIAIGMLNPDTMSACTRRLKAQPQSVEDNITYKPGSEKEIIEAFWKASKAMISSRYLQRALFDYPFI